MAKREKILEIRNLSISFATGEGILHAVRGVNLDVHRGETVAIVGESGSGKSVTARAAMGILAPNSHVDSGTMKFWYEERTGDTRCRREADLLRMSERERRRAVNGRRIAMVFQDPMTSLDPTMAIGEQLMEGMRWHNRLSKAQARRKAVQLLELVGIPEGERRLKQYPHQFSGGQRQRIVIAMALACDPELLICDEPTTALDVTIQARILELIARLQKKLNLSVIYITHDLGVVAKVADFVHVMYAGKIVESGTAEEIFYDPRHPYTWGLLSAIPDLHEKGERLYTIPGTPPNLLHEILGDAFAPRNRYALKIDYRREPPMVRLSDTHSAATWLLDERAPHVELPAALRARIARMKQEGNVL